MNQSPWNPDDMTIDQARTEYQRMRGIAKPSTADLVREGKVARRIETLARQDWQAAMDAAAQTYGRALVGVGR